MRRGELKLNDFEDFARYLKSLETEEETGWGMFYDGETDIFTPPILEPETLPEYQLDHYAYWMVIAYFSLLHKPRINLLRYCHNCYACYYTRKTGCRFCPIKEIQESREWGRAYGCAIEYYWWTLGDSYAPEYAYKIAHLEWVEVEPPIP